MPRNWDNSSVDWQAAARAQTPVAPAPPPFDIATEVGSREFLKPCIRLGLPARLRKLPCADFAFYGRGPHGLARIGVERKTINEMVSAKSRQRYIATQLPRMLDRYHFSFLVVEGLTKVGQDGSLQFGREAKQGGLVFWETAHWQGPVMSTEHWKRELSLRLLTTMHVVNTGSPVETAWFLHALYFWFQKDWSAHGSVFSVQRDGVRDSVILNDRSMRREIFARLPGIDWKRSARISNYFRSVREAAAASEDEWMQALGMKKGRITARNIVRFLSGEDDRQAKG